MSDKGRLLSERDYSRIEIMLRWFERVGRNLRPMHRRRSINTAQGGRTQMFQVTAINTSYPWQPVECKKIDYDPTTGVVTELDAETYTVYVYPSFLYHQQQASGGGTSVTPENQGYNVGDLLFAYKTGSGHWVSMFHLGYSLAIGE